MSGRPGDADAFGSTASRLKRKKESQPLSMSNAQLHLPNSKVPDSLHHPASGPPETSQPHLSPTMSNATVDSTPPRLYDPSSPSFRVYDPAQCETESKERSSSPSPPQPAVAANTGSDLAQIEVVYDDRRLLPVGTPESTADLEAESNVMLLVSRIMADLRQVAIHEPDFPLVTIDGSPEAPDWSPCSTFPISFDVPSNPITGPPHNLPREHAQTRVISSPPVHHASDTSIICSPYFAALEQEPLIASQHQKERGSTDIPTPPNTDPSLDDVKENGEQPTQAQEQATLPVAAPAQKPTSSTVDSTPGPSSGKRKAARAPRGSKMPKRTKVEATLSQKGPPLSAQVTPVPIPHIPHTPQPAPVATQAPKKRKAPAKKKVAFSEETVPAVDEIKVLQQPSASAAPTMASSLQDTSAPGPDKGHVLDNMTSNVVIEVVNAVVSGAVKHSDAAKAKEAGANVGRPERVKKRKAPFDQAIAKSPAKKTATKSAKAGTDSDATKAPAKGRKTAAEPKKAAKPRAPRAPKSKTRTPTLPLPTVGANSEGTAPATDMNTILVTPGIPFASSAASPVAFPTLPPFPAPTSANDIPNGPQGNRTCSCASDVSDHVLHLLDTNTGFSKGIHDMYGHVVPKLCPGHRHKHETIISIPPSGENSYGRTGHPAFPAQTSTSTHLQPPSTNGSTQWSPSSSLHDANMTQMHHLDDGPQSAELMRTDLPYTAMMGGQTSVQSQTASKPADTRDWPPQLSPPGGFKPQQKSAPMPPPVNKPPSKSTKATGTTSKAVSKTAKAKATAEAQAMPLPNAVHHADDAAVASLLSMMSAPGQQNGIPQPPLLNGSYPPVAPVVALSQNSISKPVKAAPKPRKKATKPGSAAGRPALNFARDAAYSLQMMTEILGKRPPDGEEPKTHGAVTDAVIYKLLSKAQHPNTDPTKGPTEVHCMSGPEAYAAMDSGWPDMPIVTENQQGFTWAPTSRPIEEIFDRMENLDRNVSVQIPTRDCKDDSFESRDLSSVRDRFLARQETNEPWNILDLRSPIPATILPAFLNGRNSQLLLRLRDAVLMPDRAERGSASIEQWNEWRDVLEWVLLSEGGHNTSPHTDSHGLATWITVQEGQFGFGYLSHPTLEEREAWTADPHNFDGGRWRYVVLDPGQTVFFNSGTVHFVFRLRSEQTLALGGHILQWSGVKQWIEVVSSQMNNPHITNEDMEWSAPKYVRMVGELVEKRMKAGKVEELGGQEKVDELLKMIVDFDEKFVKPRQKKVKSKSKSRKKCR